MTAATCWTAGCKKHSRINDRLLAARKRTRLLMVHPRFLCLCMSGSTT